MSISPESHAWIKSGVWVTWETVSGSRHIGMISWVGQYFLDICIPEAGIYTSSINIDLIGVHCWIICRIGISNTKHCLTKLDAGQTHLELGNLLLSKDRNKSEILVLPLEMLAIQIATR